MGFNWNEIKSRALLFSKTWADACNEGSQAKPFWIGLFEIFGITHKRVAAFELNVQKRGGAQGFVSLFWPGFAGEPHSDKQRNAFEQTAKGVRDARAQFVDASVAGVYEPLTMLPALFKAHQKLDAAVDAGCLPSGGKKSYACGAERVGFRVEVYQRISSLLAALDAKKTRKIKNINLINITKLHKCRKPAYLSKYSLCSGRRHPAHCGWIFALTLYQIEGMAQPIRTSLLLTVFASRSHRTCPPQGIRKKYGK